VGFLGALVFERLAAWTRGKIALVASLVVWSGVVIYGYRFLRTPADAVWMSATIALVLGGSQALSRSLFSCMIPRGREASFFAIYEISSSGTSWIGPFIFALVVATTNSYRQALLSLIVLFVVGTLLLIFTDVERAFAEARGSSGERMDGPAPLAVASPPRWVRRVLDEGVVRLARLMRHVFFREVEVTGREGIPRGVPLVFVANHNNSVVDSVLLLALPGARPRMLAKSTLFSHPVMGPLLALAGALPVYRRQDASADVSRNFETFAHCRRVLAAGGQIALFPEGTSHNERRLPIKSGAARIVLEAEALQGPLGIRIVPVGLNYEAKDRFRSKVWVCVGHAVDPAVEVIRHREEPRAAVRALTERIAVALEEVTPGLEGLRVAAPELPERVHLAWRRIPYRIPGWISDGLSTTPDEPATYKLLAGLLAFPLAWGAETAIVARFAGLAWGLAMAVVAPASGYAALRLHEQWTPWTLGRRKDPPGPTWAGS
jgi:1-acyl-sn-glycerol-3-phosphate acyltransferase